MAGARSPHVSAGHAGGKKRPGHCPRLVRKKPDVQEVRRQPGPPSAGQFTADPRRTSPRSAPGSTPARRPTNQGGPVSKADSPPLTAADRSHWAFKRRSAPRCRNVEQPVTSGPLANNSVQTPIDAFLLKQLEDRGLSFSPPADRATLIRRASFDLIGLPPTPAEVDEFVRDPAPDAYRPPGRAAVGLAPLRRALGPPLARRGRLCRYAGDRQRRGHHRAARRHLEIPRLRDPRLQRQSPLRPLPVGTDRRR